MVACNLCCMSSSLFRLCLSQSLSLRMHAWSRDKGKNGTEKTPAPSEIWTPYLMITRHSLNRCATTIRRVVRLSLSVSMRRSWIISSAVPLFFLSSDLVFVAFLSEWVMVIFLAPLIIIIIIIVIIAGEKKRGHQWKRKQCFGGHIPRKKSFHNQCLRNSSLVSLP